MKKLKKIASVCLTSALLIASLSIAASAVERVDINAKYSSELIFDQSFEPVSYLQGFYQKANFSHRARAGTHYNAGSVNGAAYVEFYYVNRNGKTRYVPENTTNDIGTGWRETSWAVLPSDAITPTKIVFYGKKFLANTTIVDKITVN